MNNDIKLNPQEQQIQGLLDRYLVTRNNTISAAGHADDDTLSSFVEGTLNEREATTLVNHLIDCGFCRHSTAELFTLRMDLEDVTPEVIASEQPARISEVLSGIFSKIFGSSEGAVFAHEEPDENGEKDKSDDSTEQ